jgi:hypothetical protein
LYNLLVTSNSGQWDKAAYEYELGRSVREYTDDVISEKYKALDKTAIAALTSFPCLFAYEDHVKKSARIGWLTDIKPRTGAVRIEYEIEGNLPPITAAKITKLTSELDITDWELNRTHWAVKDVSLLQVLIKAGILAEEQIRRHSKDSKLVRFGLTKPITDLQVRPSVFRVPSGKVEADLVSVMMPFEVSFNKVHDAVKAACKMSSLRSQRADDIWDEAEVIQDVFSLIYRSRVVVCDFSGRNPNVFYEAGIAHTLGKLVIPIVQNDADIPFDLRHIRFIKYLNNGEGRSALTQQVAEKLRSIVGT